MKAALIIGLALILSACSTGPNYKPEAGKTLVVGRIIYTGKGQESGIPHINMNGISKRGIEITIQESKAKKVTIKSEGEGLFYYHAPANTKILFTKLVLKKEDVDGSYSTLTYAVRARIKTAKVGVTNIGTIIWKATEDGSHSRRKKDKKGSLKTIFKKTNPNSPWLKETWNTK